MKNSFDDLEFDLEIVDDTLNNQLDKLGTNIDISAINDRENVNTITNQHFAQANELDNTVIPSNQPQIASTSNPNQALFDAPTATHPANEFEELQSQLLFETDMVGIEQVDSKQADSNQVDTRLEILATTDKANANANANVNVNNNRELAFNSLTANPLDDNVLVDKRLDATELDAQKRDDDSLDYLLLDNVPQSSQSSIGDKQDTVIPHDVVGDLPSDVIEKHRQFHLLPKKALHQMRFVAFLSSLLILVLLLVVGLVINVSVDGAIAFEGILAAVVLVWLLVILVYFILTKWQYNYTAYALDDDGLVIRKGMLWRSETFALRSRVQHIDVSQDPMSRLFGLSTIKVYTAGTKLGSISLQGLEKSTAEFIRNQLITQTADTL